jgi:hypothetical protein
LNSFHSKLKSRIQVSFHKHSVKGISTTPFF